MQNEYKNSIAGAPDSVVSAKKEPPGFPGGFA